jgi:hypothetical protein
MSGPMPLAACRIGMSEGDTSAHRAIAIGNTNTSQARKHARHASGTHRFSNYFFFLLPSLPNPSVQEGKLRFVMITVPNQYRMNVILKFTVKEGDGWWWCTVVVGCSEVYGTV